jgi:hypothetical protein
MRARSVGFLLSLFFLALPAPRAGAEESWQYQGVTFTPRAGWCGAPGVDAGGVSSFVARPCDQQWPQLSMAPMIAASDPLARESIETLMSSLSAHAASSVERERVAEIGRRSEPGCVITNYEVEPNPLAGIRAVGVVASFQCPRSAMAYHNVTVLVRGRDQ